MIRSICLNPTIDRTYYVDDFIPGNPYRNTKVVVDVGGKGINVAKVAAGLCVPVVCYGFLGRENGRKVKDALLAMHADVRFREVPGETRTTVNIIDHAAQKETEILEAGPRIGEAEAEELLKMISGDIQQDDIVICSGLYAPGIPDDYYARISRACREKGAYCILDSNGKDLRNALDGSYWMIKPNARELCEINDVPVTEEEEKLIPLGQKLLGNTKHVLVSMGSRGGLLISCGEVYCIHVPRVQALSTIGSGDSVVAGFAVGIQRGLSIPECARLALACGTANALTEKVAMLNRRDIEKILPEIKIERIRTNG